MATTAPAARSKPTCEEQVDEHMAGRLNDLRALNGLIQQPDGDSEETDRAVDEYRDSILSDDVTAVHRLQLSFGGPADYWYVHVRDGEITRVDYVFQDWFDRATRTLEGSDFEIAAMVLGQVIVIEG